MPARSLTEDEDALFTDGSGTVQYAKVCMKLIELLTGDFFNEYIKKGNILMLAEGRSGVDHTFALADGILRVEVDKATFERTGLEGKLVSSEGRKHVKARYGLSTQDLAYIYHDC
jgi:ribonuclease P/MRP protein subunit RPP40